jgi:hypothetical protein
MRGVRARAHEKWFYDSGPHPTRWSDVLAFPESAGTLATRGRRGMTLPTR